MAKRTSSFEAVIWADLWEALEHLTGEGPFHAAGLRIAEVTHKVQGQLSYHHPMVAMRMSRVIELRFTSLGVAAYLRTGIHAGQDRATPEAGALLVGLCRFDPATGENGFIRYPRVKRTATWRQDLRGRLREVLDDLEAGAPADPRRAACSLAELMTAESDGFESDLTREQPASLSPGRWPEPTYGVTVSAAHPTHWDDFQAAGVSLPVWLSVVASLGLVMAVLL